MGRTERESGTGSDQSQCSVNCTYVHIHPSPPVPPFAYSDDRVRPGEAVKGRSEVRKEVAAGRFARGRKLAEEGAVALLIAALRAAGCRCQEGEGRKEGVSSPEFARLASEREREGRRRRRAG